MKYTLAVLTHNDASSLSDCLSSFDAFVKPAPDRTVIVIDGPTKTGFTQITNEGRRFGGIYNIEPQEGFCAATKLLWELAAAGSSSDYVFYLEHDFVFTREVDLEPLAATLDGHPELAQMSLMRNPVNWLEKAAGSLVNAHPDWYEMHHRLDSPQRYMTQRAYFTTNPSLMPRQFMVDNPWPDHERECEGKFGIELVAKGYAFGVWGHGEVWTEHIGQRTGKGY